MFFSKLPALVDFYHDGRAEYVIRILVPLCFVHCLLSPRADGPACIAAFDMSHLLLLLDVELTDTLCSQDTMVTPASHSVLQL